MLIEYFYIPNIPAIASAIGPIISTDERTRKSERCHYARVLVELDLRKLWEEFVMFEIMGHCYIASIGYERLPVFCSKCEIVGHSDEACHTHPSKDKPMATDPKPNHAKDIQYVEPMHRNKKCRWVQVHRESRPPSPFGQGTSKNPNLEELPAALPSCTTSCAAGTVSSHANTTHVIDPSIPLVAISLVSIQPHDHVVSAHSHII